MLRRTLAIIALICILFIAGCRPAPAPRPPKAGAKPAAQYSPAQQTSKDNLSVNLNKASVIWDDGHGRRLWEAGFKEAVASQVGGSGTVKLRGVKAKLYKDGKLTSSLIAPEVTADYPGRTVRATGGVKVTSMSGDGVATCDQLVWKASEDRIIGTGNVRVVKKNLIINAGTFVADTALKNARFTDARMSLE